MQSPVPDLSTAYTGRIGAIDLARGFAVCLMILSHGTNGLMPLDDFPAWGQVPIHAITKFSSSLFVIVFGIALAVAFVPKTSAPTGRSGATACCGADWWCCSGTRC